MPLDMEGEGKRGEIVKRYSLRNGRCSEGEKA
jgi:hypothetical protein